MCVARHVGAVTPRAVVWNLVPALDIGGRGGR
jgi:hypothetical protein